jgi:hypothetical protein
MVAQNRTLPFEICHLNFELFLGFWRLEAPTQKAVREYRKDDERNHNVEPVTLDSEGNNREGNPSNGSRD